MAAAVDFMQSAGGGNIASQALQTITNVFMAAKQHKRQKELLRMQQEYQTKERKESQDWQRDMWQHQFDSTNRYNTPAAQMARYVEAGLNPDLMYSQNGVQGAMMGSVPGSTASGAPAVPQPAGDELLVQAGQGMGDLALKTSETISNIANARNKDSETRINGVLETKYGTEITLNEKLAKISDEQLNILQATCTNIEKQGKLYDQQLAKLNVETDLSSMERDLFQKTFSDRVSYYTYNNRKVLAEAGISEETLRFLPKTLEMAINESKARASRDNSEAGLNRWKQVITSKEFQVKCKKQFNINGKQVDFFTLACYCLGENEATRMNTLKTELKYFEKYADAEAWVGLIEGIMTAIGAAIGAVIGIRSARPTKSPNIKTAQNPDSPFNYYSTLD